MHGTQTPINKYILNQNSKLATEGHYSVSDI